MKNSKYQLILKVELPNELKGKDDIHDADALYGFEEKIMRGDFIISKEGALEVILNELKAINWDGVLLEKAPKISIEVVRKNRAGDFIVFGQIIEEKGERTVEIA